MVACNCRLLMSCQTNSRLLGFIFVGFVAFARSDPRTLIPSLVQISAAYTGLENVAREGPQEFYIAPERTDRDIGVLKNRIRGLGVSPANFKFYRYNGHQDKATANNIRKVCKQIPPRVLTIIYMALHTELGEGAENGSRAFVAADFSGHVIPNSPGVIFYSELFASLSKAPSQGSSVMLLTETCRADNIMRLPHKCWVEFSAGRPCIKREHTEFFANHEWKPRPLVVQSAATEPRGYAAYFKKGAVYTQAFCKTMDAGNVTFREMMIGIQTSMNLTLQEKESDHVQLHVLYSSHVIADEEGFWSAFESRQSSVV